MTGSGNALNVATGAGNHTIAVPLVLNSSQTWNIAGGVTLTVSGAISGTGALSMATGSGTLILSNSGNSYSGATTISAGTLKAGVANALPTGTTLTVYGNGAKFDLNGYSQQVAGLSDNGVSTGTVTDSGGTAILTIANSGANTFSGTISGTNLSLVKNGIGALSLSGSNSYGGGTTINAGTIAAGSNTALGSGMITLAGGSCSSPAAAAT